jgi:hypothetical protein
LPEEFRRPVGKYESDLIHNTQREKLNAWANQRMAELIAEQPTNLTHSQLLDEIKALHSRKAADYATGHDPYSNFRYAACVAEPFTDPVDRVFATLLGVKLARIAELRQPGRVVRNEPLDDSFVDLTNYAAIWASYRRDEGKK